MVYKILTPLENNASIDHMKLLQCAEYVHEDFSAIDAVGKLDSGELAGWTIEGENLIILTKCEYSTKTPFLFIEMVIGSGMSKHFFAIVEDLKTIAREAGVKKISSMAIRSGWEKLTAKVGFTPVAVEYELRI